jgi:hypothetical protein
MSSQPMTFCNACHYSSRCSLLDCCCSLDRPGLDSWDVPKILRECQKPGGAAPSTTAGPRRDARCAHCVSHAFNRSGLLGKSGTFMYGCTNTSARPPVAFHSQKRSTTWRHENKSLQRLHSRSCAHAAVHVAVPALAQAQHNVRTGALLATLLLQQAQAENGSQTGQRRGGQCCGC